MAHKITLEVNGSRYERQVTAADFFAGLLTTAARGDEILPETRPAASHRRGRPNDTEPA